LCFTALFAGACVGVPPAPLGNAYFGSCLLGVRCAFDRGMREV
jgi:hypothetical protein